MDDWNLPPPVAKSNILSFAAPIRSSTEEKALPNLSKPILSDKLDRLPEIELPTSLALDFIASNLLDIVSCNEEKASLTFCLIS